MNNPKSNFRSAFLHIVMPLSIVMVSIVSAIAQDSTVVIRKRDLNARLDSLEVEKQVRKRNGKPITDLEDKSKVLLDSIVTLRRQIANITAIAPTTAIEKSFLSLPDKSLFKPHGLFDWIIVVVGSIAAISGIVLLIGIVRALVTPRHARSPRTQTSQKPPSAAGSEVAYPAPQGDRDSQPQQIPGTYSDPLSRLRQRITDDSAYKAETVDMAMRKPSSSPFPLPKTSTSTPSDIDAQVIEAARDGLDVQEISRRLHISADQVSLILKVARSRPR